MSKYIFIFTVLIKYILFIALLKFASSSEIGGGDANYYNQFAIGEQDTVTSIWPVLLRALDDVGLYNRVGVTNVLFFISTLITPILFASLLPKRISGIEPKKYKLAYWSVATIIAIYPTLFIYSLDIFRDAIMVFLVGVCMHVIKKYIDASIRKKIFLFVIAGMLIYLVYLFRPYLGFSLLLAFLLYRLNLRKVKYVYIVGTYFALLMIANSSGALNAILEYRGESGFEEGGSSLGIGLIGKNPVEFIFLFLYSALLQFFGLYITSMNAFIFFVVESIFIIYCIYYIIKNSQYLTPFLRYLLTFSICYATIWILGNDNLGTAIRLRMYDYLEITIVAASLYLIKNVEQKISK